MISRVGRLAARQALLPVHALATSSELTPPPAPPFNAAPPHPSHPTPRLPLQLDVLVDGLTEDGEIYGRTQWDAPDVDPIVFLSQPEPGSGVPELLVGQMRRCRVTGASLVDLEAVPVA